MTRGDLKRLVKECLIELLTDGLGQLSTPSPAQSVVKESIKPRRPERSRISQDVLERIKQNAGGDDVMKSILEDTARSTLPKMLQGENSPPISAAGTAERLVASATPEDLFGSDVSAKWASLAFSDNIKTS